MTRIERFEDIEAWQKARELAKQIYAVTSVEPFSRDFALRDQIRCAAISIMSNIAEGFGQSGDVEFRRFLSIAKGSASEVNSQLYVALDTGLIDQAQFDSLSNIAADTRALLGGLMRYLASNHNAQVKVSRPPVT